MQKVVLQLLSLCDRNDVQWAKMSKIKIWRAIFDIGEEFDEPKTSGEPVRVTSSSVIGTACQESSASVAFSR